MTHPGVPTTPADIALCLLFRFDGNQVSALGRGRCRVRELIDRIDNPTPDRHAGGVTSGRQLVARLPLSALSLYRLGIRY
jgi:hypothetical protein